MLGIVDYSDSEDDNDVTADAINNVNDVSADVKNGINHATTCNEKDQTIRLKKRKSPLDLGDSDEEEKTEIILSDKRKKKKKKNPSALPLPSCFGVDVNNVMDDTVDQHQGRKRNFEHVEGNWASYIYVPLDEHEDVLTVYRKTCSLLESKLQGKIHILPLRDCHMSLSRTVALRHYWIDSIFSMLKEGFSRQRKFFYSLDGLEVYTNDNATRTFVSMKVNTSTHLLDAVAVVDSVFKEFNLDLYYKELSFHISVAWCLGDQKESLERMIKNEEASISGGLPRSANVLVADRVCVKFGHKTQQIELKDKT